MKNASESAASITQYDAAHAAHYGAHDLPEALALYSAIIVEHEDSPQAAYSRSQIENLVNTEIPKQELLDAQVALLVARFAHVQDAPPVHGAA